MAHERSSRARRPHRSSKGGSGQEPVCCSEHCSPSTPTTAAPAFTGTSIGVACSKGIADVLPSWYKHRWLVVPLIHTFTKDDAEASHKLAIRVLASGLSPVDIKPDQEDVLAFDVGQANLQDFLCAYRRA